MIQNFCICRIYTWQRKELVHELMPLRVELKEGKEASIMAKPMGQGRLFWVTHYFTWETQKTKRLLMA